MSMRMTDQFCSFTGNVIYQSCFLLSLYGSTARLAVKPTANNYVIQHRDLRSSMGIKIPGEGTQGPYAAQG